APLRSSSGSMARARWAASVPSSRQAFPSRRASKKTSWRSWRGPLNGSGSSFVKPGYEPGPPLWLLAELTYRCPLQCPYCSNPLDFARSHEELSTAEWIEVFRQAREMGAAQLGFSGGEPLVRQDLAELIEAARGLG